MEPDPRRDLLRYYSAYYSPDLVDLSSSNPRPAALETGLPEVVPGHELSYVPPTGPRDLMASIAARYETLEPDDIVLAAGASEALAALALGLVRPGTCVSADRGVYPSFLEAARRAGAEVVRGVVPPAGCELAVACSPSTPDGQVMDTRAFLDKCACLGALPVLDEVYRDLSLTGEPIPAAADLSEHAISVGGLSKPLGLGGLRIGWIASRNREVGAAMDRQVQLLSGGPASLSVTAALAAFECFDAAVAATICRTRENAPRIYRALHEAGWTFREAAAGLTIEARPPHAVTVEAEERLREAGYFLIPCEVYETAGAYRISLLADPGHLARAMATLTA